MSRPLRVLKFDSAHPLTHLQAKQQECREFIGRATYEEYYRWLMEQRVGLSDYLTHYMNEAGWNAREFLAQDDILLQKLVDSGQIPGANGPRALAKHVAGLTFGEVASLHWASKWRKNRKQWLIQKYVESYQPDVIFIREPSHVDGRLFDRFRKSCVIASFIGCNTNHAIHWDEHRSDIIFTLTEEYRRFFEVQGVESQIFSYGVDERIADQLRNEPKQYDCTFVGYLGQATQSRKTELLEQVAGAVDFKWWGIKGEQIGKYPALERAWQGTTGGIDMLRIYRRSKIVLNDYVDMAAGVNVNLRTKEVLGVGSFLLTRHAENIEELRKQGVLETFADATECVAKVRKYLDDDATREAMAAKGLDFALREFNYRAIARKLMEQLETAWSRKQSGTC